MKSFIVLYSSPVRAIKAEGDEVAVQAAGIKCADIQNTR
jgi:hypothetical protein